MENTSTGTLCHKQNRNYSELANSIRVPKRAQRINELIAEKKRSIEAMLTEPAFADFVINQFENAGRKADAHFIANIAGRRVVC